MSELRLGSFSEQGAGQRTDVLDPQTTSGLRVVDLDLPGHDLEREGVEGHLGPGPVPPGPRRVTRTASFETTARGQALARETSARSAYQLEIQAVPQPRLLLRDPGEAIVHRLGPVVTDAHALRSHVLASTGFEGRHSKKVS